MPDPDFSEAVARVWGAGSEPVGSAFLVGPRTLLTCAHVLAHARGGRSWRAPRRPPVPQPGWEVEVDFPQHDPGPHRPRRLTARAVAVQPADGLHGDICVLELLDDEPEALARLVLHPLDDLQGRRFRTFGYPADFEDGASAQGRLRGLVGAGWLEAVTDEIAPGFSGAPVWADHLSGVVGMVVARHGSGRAYAIPVRGLLEAHPPLREMALPPSPYRGLEPFEQEDAPVFAGRDTLAGELADLAGEYPVTVVHGPSGVGKTSLVRAGVLPRLAARGAATAAVRLHPRIDLPAEIATTLRVAGDPAPAAVREKLARLLARPDPAGLPALLRSAGADRLVVVLDQLDEVLAADPTAARALDAYVARLTRAPEGVPPPVRVLVTVRDTFRQAAYEATPALYSAWDACGWAVNPPTSAELREMITKPLRTVRCAVDPELVGQIVDDARAGASALPLVQETLSALYQRRVPGARRCHRGLEAAGRRRRTAAGVGARPRQCAGPTGQAGRHGRRAGPRTATPGRAPGGPARGPERRTVAGGTGVGHRAPCRHLQRRRVLRPRHRGTGPPGPHRRVAAPARVGQGLARLPGVAGESARRPVPMAGGRARPRPAARPAGRHRTAAGVAMAAAVPRRGTAA
jgi:molybdopterin-guanine dinucleotide biosynthesis protein